MDRLHEHGSKSSLDIDIADRSQRHAATGVKRVHQAFGWTLTKLLLDHPKQFRLDGFQLKMGTVGNSAAAIGSFCTTALERFGQEATFSRKRLLGTGRDFAQSHSVRVPSDDMSTVGDVDPSLVLRPINHSRLMDGVKLGVERSAENVKR